MPFKSEKQRRYLWAKHPEIARKWADKYKTPKDLPMYVNTGKNSKSPEQKEAQVTQKPKNDDAVIMDEKTAAFSTLLAASLKKANSIVQKVELPENKQPTYAGQTEGKPTVAEKDETALDSDENAAKSLLSKIGAVLSPRILKEIEERKALEEARKAQYIPQNVNLKSYPVNSAPQIPPPMGMTPPPAAPAQPQPAQPAQNTMASVGGGSSPMANPINSFGALSMDGNINGNAAFGAKNSPDSSKIAAAISKWAAASTPCSCGCGDTVATCKCSADCKCRKPGGSCYKAEKKALHIDSNGKIQFTPQDALMGAGVGLAAALPAALYTYANSKKKPAAPAAAPAQEPNWAQLNENSIANSKLRSEAEVRRYLQGWANKHKTSPGYIDDSWEDLEDDLPLRWGPDAFHPDYLTDDLHVGIGNRLRDPKTHNAAVKDLLQKLQLQTPPEKQAGTPAWQRSEGKNDEGGLNAKGRASYNKATGGNLKAPVTESNPKGKRAKRQNSFCSRMCGMKRVNTGSKTKKDPESRINKALRKWNCKCGSDKSAASPFGGGPMTLYEFGKTAAKKTGPMNPVERLARLAVRKYMNQIMPPLPSQKPVGMPIKATAPIMQ